jgi:hypothetical protein
MDPERTDKERESIRLERVERRILLLRGHRVMLDVDLAQLYGVPTKRLNEQVKRNLDRFPSDFMFRLSLAEVEEWNRSQIATGSQQPTGRPSERLRGSRVRPASTGSGNAS